MRSTLLRTVSSLCLLAVAACGQPLPPPSPLTPPDTTSPSDLARCVASDLSGDVRVDDAATGDRYGTLVVTNQGDENCTLNGVGELQLVGSQDNDLPTDVRRTLDPEPTAVLLRPGGQAGMKLHWVVVPVGGEPTNGPCQPTAVSLEVTPPAGADTFSVPWAHGPVCWQGRLDTSAYMRLDES